MNGCKHGTQECTHASHPLNDSRVQVRELDVAKIIRKETRAYDAILLDVDNGPEGLTRKENDWLYELNGLNAAFAALRVGGTREDAGHRVVLAGVGGQATELAVGARAAARLRAEAGAVTAHLELTARARHAAHALGVRGATREGAVAAAVAV